MPTPREDQETDETASAAPVLSGQDLLLWSALPDLTLNIAQTAALCGISVRQLGYWTKQGYVPATGKGARRLFGPSSLRRILAIRQAMNDGLTLRQALRALDSGAPSGKRPAARTRGRAAEHDAALPAASSSQENTAVSAELLALMQRNRQTRDSAGGLSTKLGRAENDVRHAAEGLAARGTLHVSLSNGDTVYSLAGGSLA